jgi:hypothetical protein
MTDVPPPRDPRYDPRDEPYEDRRRDDRDGGGRGWQLLAVGLAALIAGAGAAYLIKDDGDGKTEVRTVQRDARTVTVQTTPTTPDAVTVTQPPAETVVKTTTVTVTVPTGPDETATEP